MNNDAKMIRQKNCDIITMKIAHKILRSQNQILDLLVMLNNSLKNAFFNWKYLEIWKDIKKS